MLSEGLPGKPNDFILLGSGHLPFLTSLSQLVVSTIIKSLARMRVGYTQYRSTRPQCIDVRLCPLTAAPVGDSRGSYWG